MYVFSSNKIERNHTAACMWKHIKLNQLISVKPEVRKGETTVCAISQGDPEGIWKFIFNARRDYMLMCWLAQAKAQDIVQSPW